MAARRHHYVPQCYLRAFSVPRKKTHQLVVFDREVRKVFPTGTENIALERDFNRLDIEGVSSDAIEVGLSKFESDLALALQRTISGGGFQNDDDRAYVLNFVGLMALRNPRWRERRRQIREQIANTAMDLVLASKERFDSQMKRAKRDGFLAEELRRHLRGNERSSRQRRLSDRSKPRMAHRDGIRRLRGHPTFSIQA